MVAERTALFLCEGSSDLPLADLIERLFIARGLRLQLTKPDFSLLDGRVARDVKSRLIAGRKLMGHETDLVVFHRDTDNSDVQSRRREMEAALHSTGANSMLLPIIPVRMTEAWLLLDESAIRTVAGNPRGRMPLALPTVAEAERLADPKSRLKEVLVTAADVTGRRRERLQRRFDSNRRQLLERLDSDGPVVALSSWQQLLTDVEAVAHHLK